MTNTITADEMVPKTDAKGRVKTSPERRAQLLEQIKAWMQQNASDHFYPT